MTAARTIPAAVLKVQIEASDPATSAWVAANAGSGKTHVLAQRVIRLLLAGIDPAKILCITFTKAAASNMANRVFTELARWTALDDKALDAAIGRLSNVKPDARLRAQARRLFATALETPGGLKVQTIHAFCTRLLHQFPFEANVAARFDVLDGASETQLLNETTLQVLLEASADPESRAGRALTTAIASAADQTFRDVVSEAIGKRDALRKWIGATGGVDQAIAQLCDTLGIATTDSVEQVEAEITDGPLLPPSEWRSAAAALRQGSKTDNDKAARLEEAFAEGGSVRLESYLDVFFTRDRANPRASLATRAIQAAHPDLCQRLADEKERLVALTARRRAVRCRDRTFALITIADAVLTRYRGEKDRRGLLDYDDLIDRTLTLLENVDAAWVHYKLDRGVDHMLIDEAQDTSPKQWEIIRRLVEEFFTGAGARSITRTIFAVGDEKQSIFSFQDAAPRAFAEMRRYFQAAHRKIGLGFAHLQFKHSFRSGEIVLSAVDTVFAEKAVYLGVTADEDGFPPHVALPDAAPGLVEIWDTVKPDKREEVEAWDAPFDAQSETNPRVQLAHRIARHVNRAMARGARAGDVLVLVRQRGPLFDAVIRSLKEHAIPVAGADRLVLTEHIAVMDLMVLGDALLLPDDDLALATVLKSPLFGLDDDDLFKLAWERKGTLRAALRAKAGDDARYAAAAATLDRYADSAQRETPFAFYARILGPEQGRRAFLARLGREADDALDELLNVALDYERRETPSLQGFLAWLRTARTDVKRDMEITRNEVRVMTVHGAKGLEAPIVVLADSVTPPAGPPQRQPRVLNLPVPNAAPDTPDQLVWAAARATDVAPVAAARESARGEAEDEYRRLLYVAMTRAAEQLIVCGAEGERPRPAGCWYDLVLGPLALKCTTEDAEDGDGKVLRYRKAVEATAAVARGKTLPLDLVPPRPAWLDRDAPADIPAFAIVNPSRAYDESVPVRRGSGADRRTAIERGNLVHRLLQSLPDIPRERREAAAQHYLARRSRDVAPTDHAGLTARVLALLDDPRFALLFAPGSRAEVSIVGRIAGATKQKVAVSGQVDRLVVTGASVLIADYKTNRPAPRTLGEVPGAYVAQLALYRAVLAQVYPGRLIRAALIWTDVPDLMEIPAADMNTALARVTSV